MAATRRAASVAGPDHSTVAALRSSGGTPASVSSNGRGAGRVRASWMRASSAWAAAARSADSERRSAASSPAARMASSAFGSTCATVWPQAPSAPAISRTARAAPDRRLAG